MTMVKVIETIFLGPGDFCCNILGVGQENNRDLVRMLINSFIWMAVGSIYMAIVV
jgi:hypothetical protein